jgi:hypothetical protein
MKSVRRVFGGENIQRRKWFVHQEDRRIHHHARAKPTRWRILPIIPADTPTGSRLKRGHHARPEQDQRSEHQHQCNRIAPRGNAPFLQPARKDLRMQLHAVEHVAYIRISRDLNV